MLLNMAEVGCQADMQVKRVFFSLFLPNKGIYVAVGGSWANSHFDARFSNNQASIKGNDVFCSNGSYIYSLSSSCNSGAIACDATCSLATITNILSLASAPIVLTNVLQSASLTITLATSLSVDLTVSIAFISSSQSYSTQPAAPSSETPLVFTPSSVKIASGSTTASFTVSLMANATTAGFSLQGSIQLLPPVPELLVLLDSSSGSVPLTASIASPPTSSSSSSTSSGSTLSSWLFFLF